MIFIISALAVATSLAYRILNPEWVAFHETRQAIAAGDIPRASDALTRADAHGLPDNLSRLAAAHIAFEREEFASAEEPLTALISEEPEHSEGAQMLASVLQRSARVPEATHVLLNAVDAGAEPTAGLQLQLADLYRQLALDHDAQRIYETIAGSGADEAGDARLRLAELLASRRDYESSLAILNALVTEFPDNRRYRIELARVLGWNGQTEAAVAEYKKLLPP